MAMNPAMAAAPFESTRRVEQPHAFTLIVLLALACVACAAPSAAGPRTPSAAVVVTPPAAAVTARPPRVLCVTNGNTYLRAALPADVLDVVTVLAAAYPVALGSFDVTVFDRVAPRPAADAGALLYIHPEGPDAPLAFGPAPLRNQGENRLGFDDWSRTSPLLRWVGPDLPNVNLLEALSLVPGKGDLVVARAFAGPLVVAGARNDRRFVALAFDPLKSDLPLRIGWPILLANVISDFVGRDLYSMGPSTPAPGAPAQESPAPDVPGEAGSPSRAAAIARGGSRGFGGPDYRHVYGEYRVVAREAEARLSAPVRRYVERYFDAIRPQ